MTPTTLLKRLLGPTQDAEPAMTGALTLRHAYPDDADALARLAELDSSLPPRGVVLVAEVGGEIWAAVSVDDHHVVADPFRPTAELTFLLIERARQLRRGERGRMQRLPRRSPAVRAA